METGRGQMALQTPMLVLSASVVPKPGNHRPMTHFNLALLHGEETESIFVSISSASSGLWTKTPTTLLQWSSTITSSTAISISLILFYTTKPASTRTGLSFPVLPMERHQQRYSTVPTRHGLLGQTGGLNYLRVKKSPPYH